ncbi:unnamed protein product [Rhizoctonia solani]|uniref:F-box domain-containing protein n=1 Tax=Rhizoctonia solani TaxID=456999 RepID=A0A8H3DIG6_9AGAM|nr:unnamed protein product [Rhizoctonia solani]
MPNDVLDPTTKQSEDTHNLPPAAPKGYLDSCTSSEVTLGLGSGDPGAEDITSRTESTLGSSQYEMTQQLAHISLTPTRNRLSSSIFCLPDDMLFEIFSHVIYAPENQNLPMKECLQRSYSSLHNLMAVCSDWKHFAVNQGEFWTIIPACDWCIKYLAIDLSIQRAGNRGLRLATILSRHITAPRLSAIIESHASRFCALNVQSEDLDYIHNLVRQLSQVDAQLSELSIWYTYYMDTEGQCTSPPIYAEALDQAPFARLIRSLSVLRLWGCLGRWETITFSDRLVELFIHRVRLVNSGSAMESFLSAISSANELRDLTIIDLQACYNSTETTGLLARPKIVLPKLRSLVLQDLWFNVLELVLLVLAPGTYHSALKLTWVVVHIGHSFKLSTWEKIEPNNVITLLSRVTIDRLWLLGVTAEKPWLNGTEVCRLLTAVPRLKEFGLHNWIFQLNFFNQLLATSASDDGRGELEFPRLEGLGLTRAFVTDEEGFKRFLAKMRAQKVIFGGITESKVKSGFWHRLQGDEDIVGWLRCNIPGFCFVDCEHVPAPMRVGEWRLW